MNTEEKAPQQETGSSDFFLSIFDSVMSVPNSLADAAMKFGVETGKLLGNVAKGVVNLLLPNSLSEPVKA